MSPVPPFLGSVELSTVRSDQSHGCKPDERSVEDGIAASAMIFQHLSMLEKFEVAGGDEWRIGHINSAKLGMLRSVKASVPVHDHADVASA